MIATHEIEKAKLVAVNSEKEARLLQISHENQNKNAQILALANENTNMTQSLEEALGRITVLEAQITNIKRSHNQQAQAKSIQHQNIL